MYMIAYTYVKANDWTNLCVGRQKNNSKCDFCHARELLPTVYGPYNEAFLESVEQVTHHLPYNLILEDMCSESTWALNKFALYEIRPP